MTAFRWGLAKRAPEPSVAAAAAATQRDLTPAQAKAGNYRKGKVVLHGMTIVIETPAGATRRGVRDGRFTWSVTMPGHYGEVHGTTGADGDPVDVTLGPEAENPALPVWVVDQFKLNGQFDEHKCFLGWPSKKAAVAAYDASFSDGSGPSRRRDVTRMALPDFRAWALGNDTGEMAEPLAKAMDDAPPDDSPWSRMEPDTSSSSSSSTPEPASTPRDMAARIGRVFALWMREPGKAAEGEGLGQALVGLREAFVRAGGEIRPPEPAPGQLAGDGRTFFAVDLSSRNPRVEAYARAYELDRIRAITAEQRETIRQAIIAGTQEGLPIPEQARRVREAVGLSPGQAVWVQNYRTELEQGELGRAMARALRDARHDPLLTRYMESGEPLPAGQVDKMVASYQRRVLAFRATTIARTEGLRAANQGQVAGTRAWLAARPDLTVVKRWIATADDRTREAHRELDGKEVEGLDTPFVWKNPKGVEESIRYPHDPDAPADQVVRCRCSVAFRLVPRPGQTRITNLTAEAVQPEETP